jgi:hypothetical protein
LKIKRIPNSVDTLAPNNRLVKAINTIPIAPAIPYHTIMGDRGKGDATYFQRRVVLLGFGVGDASREGGVNDKCAYLPRGCGAS